MVPSKRRRCTAELSIRSHGALIHANGNGQVARRVDAGAGSPVAWRLGPRDLISPVPMPAERVLTHRDFFYWDKLARPFDLFFCGFGDRRMRARAPWPSLWFLASVRRSPPQAPQDGADT